MHGLPSFDDTLTTESVVSYHHHYYQHHPRFSLLRSEGETYIPIKHCGSLHRSIITDTQWWHTYQGGKVRYCSMHNLANYALSFFISELLTAWSRFRIRYNTRSAYYYPEAILSHTHHYWYVIIPDDLIPFLNILDVDFFEWYKKFLLTELERTYDTQWMLHHTVLYGRLPTRQELAQAIENISFHTIQSILSTE